MRWKGAGDRQPCCNMVQSTIAEMLDSDPRPDAITAPDAFLRVVAVLREQADAYNEATTFR